MYVCRYRSLLFFNQILRAVALVTPTSGIHFHIGPSTLCSNTTPPWPVPTDVAVVATVGSSSVRDQSRLAGITQGLTAGFVKTDHTRGACAVLSQFLARWTVICNIIRLRHHRIVTGTYQV